MTKDGRSMITFPPLSGSAPRPLVAAFSLVSQGARIIDGFPIDRHGMGVRFECPCPRCAAPGAEIALIVLWFSNPIDAGPEMDRSIAPPARWQRHGRTLETLSLASAITIDGHFHGAVRNGYLEIREWR